MKKKISSKIEKKLIEKYKKYPLEKLINFI